MSADIFGSQMNGKARMNVAVTRAKEGITVVSSIELEELNVANTFKVSPSVIKSSF